MGKLTAKKFDNGNYGFVNADGQKAFEVEFEGVGEFGDGFNGLAIVIFKNGNYGFINTKGVNAFGVEFKKVSEIFYGNIVRVQFLNGNWGFINDKGRNAFGAEYKTAEDFTDGLTRIMLLDGSCRFMNVRGDYAFARSKSANGNWYLETNPIEVRLPNSKTAVFNPVTGILDEVVE
jgi:hypothetical protein